MQQNNDTIEGLHVVEFNSQNIRNDPKPQSEYPYTLTAVFNPPEFMNVAFVLMHGGSERLVVQGKTREALQQLVTMNEFLTHPRLIRLGITSEVE